VYDYANGTNAKACSVHIRDQMVFKKRINNDKK
jgi:hypothetical protein